MDYTESEILNVVTEEEFEDSKIRNMLPKIVKVLACATQSIFWFKLRTSNTLWQGFAAVFVGWFDSRM
jgi:hypothetical protein